MCANSSYNTLIILVYDLHVKVKFEGHEEIDKCNGARG